MSALERVVNIGPVLAGELRSIGLHDIDAICELGAIETTRRLEAAGLHDCTHAVLAIEGAIRGVRWMSMPAADRAAVARAWKERT